MKDVAASGAAIVGTGWSLSNLPFNQIAAILTCVLVVAQLIVVAPKLIATVKRFIKKV